MSTSAYNPVRSAIILTIAFLLPLLLSVYSDRLTSVYASLWSPSANSAAAIRYHDNTTIQTESILAQQQTEHASKLLQDIRRDVGKWNSNHPRWRLMNSMKAYLRYGEERTSELDIWRKRYKKLPRSQRSTLERTTNYTNKLNSVEDLMLKNAVLAEDILSHNLQYYGVSRSELEAFLQETTSNSTYQKGTTLYAMKHFTRDWSTEGAHERDATYPCVLQALNNAFPREDRTTQKEPTRVLVPGSGLGRLGHEIAAMGGFAVTLNEMSPSMNMAYHYLTTLTTSNAATIHPYVDWWSHRATTAHLKRAATFPDDIATLSLPQPEAIPVSLIEGDFTTALKPHTGTYDAIATHFFLDTAANILTYLETLHSLLKPGGVWINFGPLLYGSAPAVQLSLDEVIAVAENLGFEIEEFDGSEEICGRPMEFDRRVRGKEVPYTSDVESLSRNAYLAQFWVARKKMALER